jgi:hypothetical protein
MIPVGRGADGTGPTVVAADGAEHVLACSQGSLGTNGPAAGSPSAAGSA